MHRNASQQPSEFWGARFEDVPKLAALGILCSTVIFFWVLHTHRVDFSGFHELKLRATAEGWKPVDCSAQRVA
jgi:hypothetical protein